ncbi:MAG: tRNA (adenosine(37)-N6)-dimethylallyltransferase MiaA [Deltaproteobacteria bacterium]|nr:tRNA (adenosine(37)-N6)-dimethylallyltransferase MiaA [Deltaproteobacteria bacterium]
MSAPATKLLTILGPTASGKTRVAARLAYEFGGEIISADSRQIYRGMDIGTGKDLGDYVVNGARIAAHLIEILEPAEDFSVYDFQTRFFAAARDIGARSRLPILCGGTALYLDCVLRGYRMAKAPVDEDLRSRLADASLDELSVMLRRLKPELHNDTDLDTREHVLRAIEIAHAAKNASFDSGPPTDFDHLVIGLRVDPAELRAKIRLRLATRLKMGLIDEARRLAMSLPPERFAYFGLEYRHLARLLTGEVDVERMERELARDICAFAKRQRTWFRRMERHGVAIWWVEPADFAGTVGRVRRWLAGAPEGEKPATGLPELK